MDRSIKDFNARLRSIRIRDVVVGAIICFITLVLLMVIFPVIGDNDDLFLIIFVTLMFLLFIYALSGTTGIKEDIINISDEKYQKEIFYVLILNIFFAFLFTCILSNLDFIISLTDPTWISIWDMQSAGAPEIIIMDILSSIVFAPIIEELLFRGVLFNRLKIRIGIIPAMLLSSFLFAIGHTFGGIVSAFLFGMCMCIIYLKTDNIFIPMTIHLLNNAIFILLSLFNSDIMFQMPYVIPVTGASVASTVLLLAYIIQESKKLKKEYS